MSTEILSCPNCASTDLRYYEDVVTRRDVLGVNNDTIRIGKVQTEDARESGFYCFYCGDELPHLDEYDKDFG